jgi:hypothetical protein
MENKYLVRRTAFVAVAAAMVAVGFNHFSVQAELRNREATLLNSVAQRRAMLASLQGRLSAQTVGIEEFKAAVRGYMVEHKGIVAALVAVGAGGSIALDENNGFSEDAKGLAATAGGIGLLYCVVKGSECTKVLSELEKADAHRKTLELEIDSTQAAIGRESSLLASDQNSLEATRWELGK